MEENLKTVRPVTELLEKGWDIERIVRDVLNGFEVEVIYEEHPEYKCKCSREKIEGILTGLGVDDLTEMAEDKKGAEVKCHFCGETYTFSPEEIEKIKEEKAKKP